MQPWLISAMICRKGWFQMHRNLPGTAFLGAWIKGTCFCCAREMLVIPQNTDRSQCDATHSRAFILVELAQPPHPQRPMKDGFGGGRAP